MKNRKSVLFTAACMILCIVAAWFVCDKQLIKKETAYSEQIYALADVKLFNIEQTKEGLLVGIDPQIVLEDVNSYVESVSLVGTAVQEEVQIFYTESTDENFSEEKSIVLAPEKTEKGCLLYINQSVADLRIDFMGAKGSNYAVNSVVLNPGKYLEWSLGVGAISALAGIVFGVCIFFLLKESRNIKSYLQVLGKYRFLLEDMVVRDIKLKYRRSVIGLLWSVLNPLLMMIVITAVFQHLFRFEIENFAVYYLTGWVIYNFVVEATSGALTSVIGASSLIRKVYIPKYIFPMQKCIFSFVNMLFSLVALFVVMLVLKVEFTWYILLIPIPMVLALIFSVGLGMILSTVAVFFRDMIHLYGVFTMVWMYLTPIIYPEEILVGAMRTIMKLNPLYYYVDCFRQLTLYGTLPEMSSVLIMGACSAFSLLIGIIVFKKKQDRFILFI